MSQANEFPDGLALKPGISSVLFVCNQNLVRSPMAEGLLKKHLSSIKGPIPYVDSAGAAPDLSDEDMRDIDGFVVSVMSELGMDLRRHASKQVHLDEASAYDVVICLTNGAYEAVKEIQASSATLVEKWDVSDPSLAVGNREQRLELYRTIRDSINRRIIKRFFVPMVSGS